MTDIYETDIDPRVEDGYVLTSNDLLTLDEWLAEFRANICCTRYTRDCPCGGNTGDLPSGVSRLIREAWEGDEPDWEAIAEAQAEAFRDHVREVELW